MQNKAENRVYHNTQILGTVLSVIGNGVLTAIIDDNTTIRGLSLVLTALAAGSLITQMFNATPEQREKLSQSTMFSIFKTTVVIQSAAGIAELARDQIRLLK